MKRMTRTWEEHKSEVLSGFEMHWKMKQGGKGGNEVV